jgi:hypothetical protein
MAEVAQCHDLLDSSKRVVRLAIDLAGDEAERLPNRLARVLNSPEVQAEIRKAMEKAGRELLEEQLKAARSGQTAPLAPDGEKVARAIGKGIYNAAPAEYLKLIKDSSQFKEIEKAFDVVLEDFNCTPVGAWIDRNKTVLIIVGAVLAVGTATAFYLTQTGDVLTKPLAGAGKEIKLGSLTLKPQLIEFTPSERKIAAKIDLAKAGVGKFSLTGTAANGQFGVASTGEVTFRLAKPLSLSLGSEFALTGIAPAETARAQWLAGPWNSYLQHHTYSTLAWKESGLALSGSALVRNDAPGLALGATYRSTTPMGLLSVGGKGELTTRAASVQGSLALSRPLGSSILEFNAALSGSHSFDRLGPVGNRALDPLPAGDELKGTANLVIYFDGTPAKK